MGAFRWPPRPIDEHAEAGHAGRDGSDHALDLGVDRVTSPARGVPAPPGVGGVGAILAGIEEALFGAGRGIRLDDWDPLPIGCCCRRCGGVVGVGERDDRGCARCRGARLPWDAAVTLGAYDGDLRHAIMACKYRRDRGAADSLGRLLGARVSDVFSADGIEQSGVLITPVPTTTRRRFENGGIDHAMLLAAGVARAMGTPVQKLLSRKHGPRMAGRSAASRARAVKGMMRARPRGSLGVPSTVILVDDVRTTGATAAECFRELRTMFGVRRGQRASGAGQPEIRFWLATAAVTVRARRERSGVPVPESGVSPSEMGKSMEKMGWGS